MDKNKKEKHIQRKDLIMLIGGLSIVVLCIGSVTWLIYQSFKLNQSIPEYYLTIFISIATLVIGYTLGTHKNG